MTARELGAIIDVLNTKLEAHLEDHREVLKEQDKKQKRRVTWLQLIVAFGMLISPVLSAVTTHVIH